MAVPSTDTAGAATEQGSAGDELSALFNEFLLDSSNTFAEARIRATFYPKFENEESDQEVRACLVGSPHHLHNTSVPSQWAWGIAQCSWSLRLLVGIFFTL